MNYETQITSDIVEDAMPQASAERVRIGQRILCTRQTRMAPEGMYLERAIAGAHGYMTEDFTSPATYFVRVPDEFAFYGFLVEPVSNSEKAIEHAYASRSAFE